MKLLLLGATGHTGQLLVKEALVRGHEVIAVVRNPDKLNTQDDKLKVFKTDIYQASELVPHMDGCDAVLSSVGGRPGLTTPCDVYSMSCQAVLKAMRETGVKRFVVITSWGTKDDPRLPFIWRWVLKPSLLRNVVKDMETMENYLQQESGDVIYTVIKPPRLTFDPPTGEPVSTCEGQLVPDCAGSMCRHDLARFMLDCLETSEWDNKMVAVTTSTSNTSNN